MLHSKSHLMIHDLFYHGQRKHSMGCMTVYYAVEVVSGSCYPYLVNQKASQPMPPKTDKYIKIFFIFFFSVALSEQQYMARCLALLHLFSLS